MHPFGSYLATQFHRTLREDDCRAAARWRRLHQQPDVAPMPAADRPSRLERFVAAVLAVGRAVEFADRRWSATPRRRSPIRRRSLIVASYRLTERMIGRVSSRVSSPFLIGRRDESERLSAAYERAAAAGAVTVIVAGEAGVGKTRLVADLQATVGGPVIAGSLHRPG